MTCSNCGAENAPLKKCCRQCGIILTGYTVNNVTGEYGYRNSDGSFTINKKNMDKEQQDLAWKYLPKVARDKIVSTYFCKTSNAGIMTDYNKGYIDALIQVYGKHNLTSDTEPEEMLHVEKWKVQDMRSYNLDVLKHDPTHKGALLLEQSLKHLFGNACLPDKRNEDNFAKPEKTNNSTISSTDSVKNSPKADIEAQKPKFDIGDWVRIIKPLIHYDGEYGIILDYSPYAKYYRVKDKFGCENLWYEESDLEPYTEEKKTMQLSDVRGPIDEYFKSHSEAEVADALERNGMKFEPIEKNDMEEKELNLAELLKDCIGDEFYSPYCGYVTLEEIHTPEVKDTRAYLLIRPKTDYVGREMVYSNGKYREQGQVTLYPSRALYEKYPLDGFKAWSEWAESRKPKRWFPKVGEKIFWITPHGTVAQDVCRADNEGNGHQLKRRAIGNEFKTGKLASQAAEEVRKTLEKFHENKQSK